MHSFLSTYRNVFEPIVLPYCPILSEWDPMGWPCGTLPLALRILPSWLDQQHCSGKVASYFNCILWEWCNLILIHYHCKPFELTDIAYLTYLSRHDHLENFTIQFIDVVSSVGSGILWTQKSCFSTFHLMSFLPKPFLSSLISLWVALDQRVHGSSCLSWHELP